MNRFRFFFTLFGFLIPNVQILAQQKLLPPKLDEKWVLSVEGSEFLKTPPLVGEVDNQPTFTRELVRLQWRFNDPIDVYLVIPKSVAKPPALLYLYNYTTNTDRFMRNDICNYFVKDGVAAIGFSTAISGYRFHDRGATEWFVSNLQEALALSTHDVQKVIDYLQTRKDLDTQRIGVFGQGSGAAVAILSASVDPRIKVLDLEDTWGDWPDWLAKSSLVPEAERPSYLKANFLKNVSALDPVDYLPKLQIPVRSQYSLPKSPVPPEARKCIEAALPPQAAHTAVDSTFNWVKRQLADLLK